MSKYLGFGRKSGYYSRRLGIRTKRYGGAKRKVNRLVNDHLTTKSEVKRLISMQSEKKFAFATGTGSNVTSAVPLLLFMGSLVQGDTDQARTGDRVRFKRLQLNFRLLQTPSVNEFNFWVEVIRVKNPRGVAPTIAQIYGSATPDPTAFHNNTGIEWSSRFQSIYRQHFHVSPYLAGTVVCTRNVMIDETFDHLADLSLGNAGTIADYDTGAFYACIYTDNGNFAPLYNYQLWYTDL